ncbi:sugar ABC transporter substrate-binding protein [Kitasatospora sp. NE20-6]|uniref:ABC transporter substrate-binding protein n=1 Tax=Kitasatospora sp. NE20-6 TaxID=2859066 RepID=UPI0034DBDF7F
MRRGWLTVAAATMTVLTACSSSGSGSSSVAAAPSDPAQVSGDITVLTNRTDLVQDGTLKKYAAEFQKLYPGVKVAFEGLTDYEGETKIRMNTESYGDVLLIPNSLSVSQYPTFFAPLGDTSLADTFDYTDHATVGNKVYGIANIGVANGFVYNKTVWAQAGITEWPTTPEQFIEDLKAVKAKTGAIPYYTNYKDGWPLTNWTNALGSPSCSAGARDELATTPQPWTAGKDLHTADKLLFDIVHEKLSEPDPTTSNWENSKTLIGSGKVGSMWLGSWAVSQMQAAAKAAGQDPSTIGFMPFPTQSDGHFCSVLRPDYQYAVNVHSKHKEAARAWLDWFITKSGSAAAEGSISSVKGTALPDSLKPFQDKNVRFVPESQNRIEAVNKIDKASEIGITSQDYRQRLMDVARGAAGGDADSFFKDLNKKWSDAQSTIGG